MAALDFPATPSVNQVYTANGTSWICTSASPVIWDLVPVSSSGGTAGFAEILFLGGM
jgi:hypothetical protein